MPSRDDSTPPPRPSLGSGTAAPRPTSNGAPSSSLDFWQSLVVAAVSAGKDADAAIALADTIIKRSSN